MSFVCPNCGADVELDALACPECGSDERTGWSEDTIYDGLDLPEEAFDDSPIKPRSNNFLLMLIAVILLVIFVLRFVFV